MAARVGIERLYLRDVSFESPKAPGVFAGEWKPKVHVDVGIRANRLAEDRCEVVLTLSIEARADDEVALIVEVQQAGVFRFEDMDDAHRDRVIAIDCPAVLFPYARETADSLATKGSLPPFSLAPINFSAVYAEAMRQAAAKAEADASAGDEPTVN